MSDSVAAGLGHNIGKSSSAFSMFEYLLKRGEMKHEVGYRDHQVFVTSGPDDLAIHFTQLRGYVWGERYDDAVRALNAAEEEAGHYRSAWYGAEDKAAYWNERFSKLEISRASCCDENEQAVLRLRKLVRQLRDALVTWADLGTTGGATETAIEAANKELNRP